MHFLVTPKIIPLRYETVSSGEGYVPQVSVVGVNETVLCCTATKEGAPGQLPFQTYLLNWTAAKEHTGQETDVVAELTPEEKDAIYRKACVYFDDQLEGVDQTNKDSCLLAQAKQYIVNHETQEEGDFRMSLAGRARASTLKKDAKKAGGMAKLKGAQLATTTTDAPTKLTGTVLSTQAGSGAQSEASWEAKQAQAASAAVGVADIQDMVFETPEGESGLEAMAAGGGRSGRSGTVSENVDMGDVYK